MNWLIEIFFLLLIIAIAYAMLFCYEKNVELNSLKINDLLNGSKDYRLFLACELLAGFIVVVFMNYHSYTLFSALNVISFTALLLPVAYVDFKKKLIPNKMLVCMAVVRLLLLFGELFFQETELMNYLISSALSIVLFCGIFFLISVVFKNSIGMGDVKLFGVLSIYFGMYGTLHILMYAMIVTFFYACYLLATKKKEKKDEISFAPMVLFGTLITLIAGAL